MSCSFHIHIGEQKAKLSSWAPMSFSIYQDDDRQANVMSLYALVNECNDDAYQVFFMNAMMYFKYIQHASLHCLMWDIMYCSHYYRLCDTLGERRGKKEQAYINDPSIPCQFGKVILSCRK